MTKLQEIRLSKYLAECGLWSRRKCEELITSGRINIDGQTITDFSFRVSDSSLVLLDGKKINPQKKLVIALNKPPGYLSTASDEFDRKTVLDLVKNFKTRLFPAGRLDRNSRGLIILTNDGELVYNITHPKFMIPKTYHILIKGIISKKDFEILRSGIKIDNKVLKPYYVRSIKINSSSQLLEIQIHEGRKRILRRVMEFLEYKVLDLKRIKVGEFDLGSIKEGQFRILKKNDIEKLTVVKK